MTTVIKSPRKGNDRTKQEPTKKGGAGRANWGSPMDDVRGGNSKTLGPSAAVLKEEAVDRNDLNYQSDEDEAEFEEYESDHDNPPGMLRRQSSVSRKLQERSEFNVMIKRALDSSIEHQEPEIFVNQILAMNEKTVHRGVFRLLLMSTCSSTHPPTERDFIVDVICLCCEREMISKPEVELEFAVCFARAPDFTAEFQDQTPLEILTNVAKAVAENGYLPATFFQGHVFVDKSDALKKAKENIVDLLKEFFVNGEYKDVCENLRTIQPRYHHEVVKKAISLAFDADNRSRDLVSRLLAYATGDSSQSVLTRAGVVSGFEILLARVDDLHKDVPDVVHMLSCFISRAVVDEVLFPSFLENVNLNQSSSAAVVVDKAQQILRQKHAYRTVGKIWGLNTDRPVDDLKTAIALLIKEYFLSEDLSEALVSVQELDTPYFHHEIVKYTLVLSAEKSPKEVKLGRELIQAMLQNGITDEHQLILGFAKVWSRLHDYKLDMPRIPEIYEQYAKQYTNLNVSTATKKDETKRGGAQAEAKTAAAPVCGKETGPKGAAKPERAVSITPII